MNPPTVFWTALIGVVAYILAVEPLFLNYMLLWVTRLTQILQRRKTDIQIHPETPWMRAQVNRNADEIATQLLNEINGKRIKSGDDGDAGGPPVV